LDLGLKRRGGKREEKRRNVSATNYGIMGGGQEDLLPGERKLERGAEI